MSTRHRAQAEAFRSLHDGPPFVMPNPPDVGTAVMLAGLGFRALATTSSGFAHTLGRRDGQVTLAEMTAHAGAIADATGLPVNADLEHGYGDSPQHAAEAVRAAAEAGAAGGSIEDFSPQTGLYDLGPAVERVAAAVEAARARAVPFLLTARAENHIRGRPDLEDTIARLRAYEDAGADVLYAPGLRPDELRRVRERTTRPINALGLPGHTVADYAGAGAQRISVGGALTWVAALAAADAARRLLDGDLGAFSGGNDARVQELLDPHDAGP